MDAKEQRERENLVAEALTWLGTPYHHAGRVKGGGTDCGYAYFTGVYQRRTHCRY